MGIFTRGKVWFSADKRSYLEYDPGLGRAGMFVEGVEALRLSATAVTELLPKTLSSTLTVGVNDTGHDVKFFGATSGKSWLWDESADKMIVTGASDLLGNTQQTGTLTVGVNGTGHDVTFFSATEGCSFLWDESADKLIITGTSASTDGGASVEPIVMNSTMTGTGGVGGRAKFLLTVAAVLGGWSNALKGQVIYNAGARTTGLGSAVLAEMTLEDGCSAGTYAPIEVELNMPSGALTGTATSFIYLSANDTPAPFDTAGYLFQVAGLTANNGKLFNAGLSQAVTAAARLRVKVGATDYFIPLCASEALTS